jgi:hypothetical protein
MDETLQPGIQISIAKQQRNLGLKFVRSWETKQFSAPLPLSLRISLSAPFDRSTSGCSVIIKDVTDSCLSREFIQPPAQTTFRYDQNFFEWIPDQV